MAGELIATETMTGGRPPGDGPGSGGRGDGGGGHRDGFGNPLPPGTQVLGMSLALAGISMLFIGLTSAYLVRQGLGSGWKALAMPPLLLVNTAMLLASSLTLETGRRLLKRAGIAGRVVFQRWLSLTLVLGVTFLFGQIVVWRQLAAHGVYLATNPHGSFFYTLTGAHGLHVTGGVLALVWLLAMSWRTAVPLRAVRVDVVALYWHFMAGLWLYLLVLVFVWK